MLCSVSTPPSTPAALLQLHQSCPVPGVCSQPISSFPALLLIRLTCVCVSLSPPRLFTLYFKSGLSQSSVVFAFLTFLRLISSPKNTFIFQGFKAPNIINPLYRGYHTIQVLSSWNNPKVFFTYITTAGSKTTSDDPSYNLFLSTKQPRVGHRALSKVWN